MLLTGCRTSSPCCTDIVKAAAETAGGVPQHRILSTSYDENSRDYLNEEEISFIYTGLRGKCGAFGLISDCAVLLSERPYVFEIHVIRARTPGDVPSLKKLVEKRAALLTAYAGKAAEDDDNPFYGNPVEIIVCGTCVMLIATPDNASVSETLRRIVSK